MSRYIMAASIAALMTPMLFARLAASPQPSEGAVSTDDTPVPGSPVTAGTPTAEASAKKSIVPSKYGDKYKNGGSDELAEFIKAQCTGKEGFEYSAFFQLCRANGIDETKVAHYETQIAEGRHGSQGRARMTLRNMLATIARKNGKLKGLDGTETSINIAKPALSGAAAANTNAESPAEETKDVGSAPSDETTGGEDGNA